MKISKTLYDQMINHGLQDLPYEACGLLAGAEQGHIRSVWPLKNEWKSSTRFYVSKKVVEETLEQIDLKGQKVLAVYHSHPATAPYPSYTDLKNHTEYGVKMVIVSYKTSYPHTKCFSISEKSYDEHPFLIDFS
ncbi:M67 family metallopeptidase [Halobacillus sp. H74]|uniref:M67 family metallopeptidase n=1 Tax=Halobacillus sp. H74 TaxID=3457436 RepID=UPI003FCCF350